eukprot:8261149-Lingulodinium_polyedra.AAC.1
MPLHTLVKIQSVPKQAHADLRSCLQDACVDAGHHFLPGESRRGDAHADIRPADGKLPGAH